MYALSRHGFRELFSTPGFNVRCTLLYSTSTPAAAAADKIEVMANYLVDSLGFSKEKAISVSTKVPPPKSMKSCDSVLNLFKQYGLDRTHIRIIVSSAPILLFNSKDKTLELKLKFLEDLGFSRSDLVKLVTSNPGVLTRSINSHLMPCIIYLKRVLGNDRDVVTTVNRYRYLLTYDIPKRMQPNLDLIRAKGLPDGNVRGFVIKNSWLLVKDPGLFEVSVQRVEEELGIPCESGMFGIGFNVFCSANKSRLEMKFGVYRSFGWSDFQINSLFRKQPLCLRLSEAKIRNGLNYFMKQLRCTVADLEQNPVLLMFSLEKRVVPRYEIVKILKQKEVDVPSLPGIFKLSDLKFVEKYVLPYKDVIPDLYETYTGKKRERVETV